MELEELPEDFFNSMSFIRECMERRQKVNMDSVAQWGRDFSLEPLDTGRFSDYTNPHADEETKRRFGCIHMNMRALF